MPPGDGLVGALDCLLVITMHNYYWPFPISRSIKEGFHHHIKSFGRRCGQTCQFIIQETRQPNDNLFVWDSLSFSSSPRRRHWPFGCLEYYVVIALTTSSSSSPSCPICVALCHVGITDQVALSSWRSYHWSCWTTVQ